MCELILEGTVVSSPGSIKNLEFPSAMRSSRNPSSAFTTRPSATFAGDAVELPADGVLSQPQANRAARMDNRRKLVFFITQLADQVFGEASR